MNNRETGSRYELLAAAYLEQQGFHIIEKNYRCRGGEIDLIAKEGNVLCFVEVKYRAGRGAGLAEEAVTPAKWRKIRRTAQYYLMERRLPADGLYRFDVVAVNGSEVTLYRNVTGA